MTKKPSYDPEGLEILQGLEAGTLKPASDADKRLRTHRIPAEATLKKKDQRLNIRISSHDLKNLQARALEESIPYQTLAASLLHTYVNGHLVNQR